MSVVLDHVTKSFGRFKAIEDLCLDVAEGEFLSLVGPSGCGKTTTLRLIAGFLSPDRGQVRLGGKDMCGVGVRERRVGIVFQNYALFPNMTAFDNVAFGMKVRKLPEGEIRERAAHFLTLVGLGDRGDSFPHQLSGGQQQRVALARALAIEPRVLLLDEPLSALDAKVRNSLRFEIKRIQRESGITAVYVTHDQEEALSISDRVALMEKGRLAQIGTPWEIYAHPHSAFVADFVGVNNLLEVECLGKDHIAWKQQKLKVETPQMSEGRKLLAIRPERLVPCHSEEEAPNRLSGTVAGRVFLGPLVRLALEVQGERILMDVLSSEADAYGIGDPISVRFAPGDARLVERP